MTVQLGWQGRFYEDVAYSTEFEVERLHRDARLMSIGESTNDVLPSVAAKSLLAGEAVIR